jgi:hypothetical protein
MSMDKTVYILGAGFSSPAGGPAQDAILGEIWNLPDDLDLKPHKTRLRGFLRRVLNVDETKVSLEDIYTPIDRCLADGLALRGTGEEELQKLRDSLGYLIAEALKERFDRSPIAANKYVEDFAKHLVALGAVRAEKARGAAAASEAKKYDPFSIISLNWDILLDNALNAALREKDKRPDGSLMTGDYEPFGVEDPRFDELVAMPQLPATFCRVRLQVGYFCVQVCRTLSSLQKTGEYQLPPRVTGHANFPQRPDQFPDQAHLAKRGGGNHGGAKIGLHRLLPAARRF